MYLLQIPDVRTGDDVIDAVVVDEESVGTEGRGCGGKILYGKGAFGRHFPQNRSKDSEVSLTWHDLVIDVLLQIECQIIVFNIFHVALLQTNTEGSDGDHEAEQELPSIVAL